MREGAMERIVRPLFFSEPIKRFCLLFVNPSTEVIASPLYSSTIDQFSKFLHILYPLLSRVSGGQPPPWRDFPCPREQEAGRETPSRRR